MANQRLLLLLALSAAVTLAWSSAVQAKEEFPGQIENQYALGYQPPCSVCHVAENTGSATPRTAFALALRSRGLTGSSKTLSSALTQLETDGVDSDGDGVTDIQELKDGTDPNSSGNASIKNAEEPGYGCGGTPPTGRGGALQGVAVALSLAWALLFRRRVRP
ncbi:MAG: thrombospondin type 3 repeat-containing protein [Polyangiaceae bacterium]